MRRCTIQAHCRACQTVRTRLASDLPLNAVGRQNCLETRRSYGVAPRQFRNIDCCGFQRDTHIPTLPQLANDTRSAGKIQLRFGGPISEADWKTARIGFTRDVAKFNYIVDFRYANINSRKTELLPGRLAKFK